MRRIIEKIKSRGVKAAQLEAIARANEGILELQEVFPASDLSVREPFLTILSEALPYTARYWVKCFEKPFEAYYVSKLLQEFSEPVEILDVGCGSGQLVAAAVKASGRDCIVDGLDDFSEKDTFEEVFLSHQCTRKLFNNDFNDLSSFTERKYDLILGLNSIRMAPNISKTLGYLSAYLKQDGKLVFNAITNKFQERFFESSFQIATKHQHPDVDRWESAKNYIPTAYPLDKLKDEITGTELKLLHYHTYMDLNVFSPYQFFVPAYQFLFEVASLYIKQPLDSDLAELYTTTYAKFVYNLTLSLPGFIDYQYKNALTGAQDGCHMMATLNKV